MRRVGTLVLPLQAGPALPLDTADEDRWAGLKLFTWTYAAGFLFMTLFLA